MGRNALSLRAHSLGGSLLRSVALAVMMLATGPGAVWRYVSAAGEPHGRAAVFNATGKDQIAFTADRAKLRAAFLYLPPRPLCQVTSPQGAEPQRVPNESQGVPKMFLDMTLEELAKEIPELKHLKSAESQDMLPMILERVGTAVADFFDNFFNTTSVEHVLFTVDSQKSEQPQHYEAKFEYLALARPGTDRTRLQEYRTDSKGKQVNVRGTVVTAGFVTLPAYFHPNYQRGSRFRYLGRDKVKGQSAYVIAFTQRPEAARQAGWVAFDDKAAFVFAQGVAWVDPARFRILRLRTDIQQPELHVGLQRETTEVEYSEVTFKQGGKTLWLPREVTVSGQTNQYTFHNEHRYSDYRLFIVQTNAKEKSP